jgi:hypothetical protein
MFVRVDNKVWFRHFEGTVLEEPELWGEFLSVAPKLGVKSRLCYYDETAGTVTEALDDDGYGNIWFGVDGFYLTHVSAGQYGDMSTAYFKSLDGTDTQLDEGYLMGVSDNGRFAAVSTMGPPQDHPALVVFEGTQRVRSIPLSNRWSTYCALADDGSLVYLRDEDKLTVCELDTSENELILGVLEPPEYGFGWELEQCLIVGSDVWCVFGAYEGTGHFLCDVLCVRMKLGVASSMETVELELTDADYPYVPQLYKGQDGSVQHAEYLKGDLYTEYDTGNLIWHDTPEHGTLLTPAFLYGSGYSQEECRIIQAKESIGDAAYLIIAQAFHDAESDVGWRMSYRMGELYYVRVPLHEEAEPETLIGPELVVAPSDESVYRGFVGTWVLYATEVEGDRSDELPEGTFEYIDFREDGTVLISGTEYENEFHAMEVLPTNGVSSGASPYGLLFTGGANDDMLWTYFENDSLVGTLMIHFNVDGGTDSYSRVGFYRESVG